jgi:SAM-dependent methyltransferase
VANYAPWCAEALRLLRTHVDGDVGSLLNLGCGGGKNISNLRREVEVVGVDLSPDMAALARTENPGCRIEVGDMRTCDLGRMFDAVVIDDAVSYMTTIDDLEAVFRNAHRHLRSGGALFVTSDATTETFVPDETETHRARGEALPEGVDVTILEWNVDPDPADTTYESYMLFVIRDGDDLRTEIDRHELGLFSDAEWVQTLERAGFDAHTSTYVEDGRAYPSFVGVRR